MQPETLERATSHHPAGEWPRDDARDRATLDFDQRHRRRVRIVTDSGTSLLLDLPKAVALAAGDGLALEGGGFVEIVAAPEPLLEVRGDDAHHLARLAWHVGNRHVPAELREDAIRIRPDHVIAEMLAGLGACVSELEAPFQPESGAYAGSHAHGPRHEHGAHAHPDGH